MIVKWKALIDKMIWSFNEIYRTWEDDSDETVEIYHSNSDNVLIEMSNGDCVKYDIYDIIKKRYSYPEKVALYSNTIVNIKEDI